MPKFHLLFILFFAAATSAGASVKDSLKTVRIDGKYNTYCQTNTFCSNQTANEVIDDFIGQFRGDPNLLFEWALKGLGSQHDDEKDEILLILKKTTFDPKTCVGSILTDIKVPGIRTFKDVSIESKVLKTRLPNGTTEITVDIYYSNLLLKKAYGTFRIVPQNDGKQLFTISIDIRFGWFFDIFITSKRYRSIIEWRAKGFMENLRNEAERRQSLLKD